MTYIPPAGDNLFLSLSGGYVPPNGANVVLALGSDASIEVVGEGSFALALSASGLGEHIAPVSGDLLAAIELTAVASGAVASAWGSANAALALSAVGSGSAENAAFVIGVGAGSLIPLAAADGVVGASGDAAGVIRLSASGSGARAYLLHGEYSFSLRMTGSGVVGNQGDAFYPLGLLANGSAHTVGPVLGHFFAGLHLNAAAYAHTPWPMEEDFIYVRKPLNRIEVRT